MSEYPRNWSPAAVLAFALAPFPLSRQVFGTARSGQGRAGFARPSEPLTARTVLKDGDEGKGGWPRILAGRRSLWFFLAGLAPFLAQGFTLQLNAVGVMNQAIEDAVGNGWVADLLVPVSHGHL